MHGKPYTQIALGVNPDASSTNGKFAVRTHVVLVLPAMLMAGAAHAAGIDLAQVAGKPKAAVEKVLGKADSCGTISPSKVGKVPKCVFQGGKVEIVFIDGKADWITVHEPGVRFDQDAIAALGLAVRKPDFSNAFTMRWKGVGGYREVAAFPGAGNEVDYLHVRAVTD